MPRPTELTLSKLESREVPAASLFADLVPGDWGSFPNNLTTSGDTLFFSAEGRPFLGTELWASDGTRAGTRLVKDINPGRAASNPVVLKAAGSGVIFFLADDGAGRTLWKSDGTPTGTSQVTGVPAQVTADFPLMSGAVGWKGELYFVTPNPNTGSLMWAKTNGTGYTVLTQFNGTAGNKPFQLDFPMRVNGERIDLTWLDTSNRLMVWETDGTPGGTRLQQREQSAFDQTTGTVYPTPGVQIAPDQFVYTVDNTRSRGPASVWVGDGLDPANTRVLKVFDTGPDMMAVTDLTAVNGKAYLMVSPYPGGATAVRELWVTDGTAEGTRKLDLPVPAGTFPRVVTEFDGRALVLVAGGSSNAPEAYHLTDGTDAGTFAVPRPAGMSNSDWRFAGMTPPDAANPRGLLVFQETATDTAYRTDGTAAGTVLIDRTGLPPIPSPLPPMYWWDPATVRSVSFGPARGVYFKGDVYFSGSTPTQRPELWRWDVDTTTPTPPPVATAPKVIGTVVNDGSAQRSMVKSITVTFDSLVTVNPAGVSITNARGTTPAFTQQLATVNGVTTLTITFPAGVGGSIADGRWTLWIDNTAVRRQGGGAAMAADYSFTFTRVFGDLTGDGIYDRATRLTIRQLLGRQTGDAGFNPALDVNGDGKIDAVDELAAVRNWGRAV